MTFYQKLQAHEGGLIKLYIPAGRLPADLRWLSGKIGVVCSVGGAGCFFASDCADRVCLFIDGKIHTVFLYKDEVEFLEGPQ